MVVIQFQPKKIGFVGGFREVQENKKYGLVFSAIFKFSIENINKPEGERVGDRGFITCTSQTTNKKNLKDERILTNKEYWWMIRSVLVR